jgi:hypothetical protein
MNKMKIILVPQDGTSEFDISDFDMVPTMGEKVTLKGRSYEVSNIVNDYDNWIIQTMLSPLNNS